MGKTSRTKRATREARAREQREFEQRNRNSERSRVYHPNKYKPPRSGRRAQKETHRERLALDTENDSERNPGSRKRALVTTSRASLDSQTVAGRRVSFDTPEDQYVGSLTGASMFTQSSIWRGLSLDEKAIRRMSPAHVAELLVDVSPELSRAFWDFLLMCNPGWELQAFIPGTETAHEKANAALSAMTKQLDELYGAVDVVFNRLFATVFLRGSFDCELVLDANARDFVDIAMPDPAYFVYRKVRDDVRGIIWQVGQYHGVDFVNLSELLTFRHVPLHPISAKPLGRAIATPALFICVFLMSILQDLKRVIQRQGYPRIDIEIIFDKLQQQMPQEARADTSKMKAWGDSVVAAVKRVYETLKPENAYIHSDAVKVNQPVGALSNLSLGAIDALFSSLERMATRALKTMPLLMATTDGVSEANANRQWEIHAAGIKALQHLCEQTLEYIFRLALRAQGIQADVQMRFAELRAAELLRDAQVELLKVTIARAKYDNGWIDQDDAAKEGADRDKAAEDKPLNLPNVTSIQPGASLQQEQAQNQNPEPGSARDAMSTVRAMAQAMMLGTSVLRQSPTGSELNQAVNLWKQFAPDVAVDAVTAPTIIESEQ
jgi:hypothetical protein